MTWQRLGHIVTATFLGFVIVCAVLMIAMVALYLFVNVDWGPIAQIAFTVAVWLGLSYIVGNWVLSERERE